MRYYAGIGARKTPPPILELMADIAERLEEKGIILRSGGAEGADEAFSSGVLDKQNQDLYVPWRGFNKIPDDEVIIANLLPNFGEAMSIAEKFHPAWDRCTRGSRALLARNTYQILGDDLRTPCEFVICWTPSDSREGGTGQALRVARAQDPRIPIYNLREPATQEIFLGGWLPD